MYTFSYTLYASRGSKCAPSCFDLPGLLNIESYVTIGKLIVICHANRHVCSNDRLSMFEKIISTQWISWGMIHRIKGSSMVSNIIFIYMMTPRDEMHTTNKVNYTSKLMMILRIIH